MMTPWFNFIGGDFHPFWLHPLPQSSLAYVDGVALHQLHGFCIGCVVLAIFK